MKRRDLEALKDCLDRIHKASLKFVKTIEDTNIGAAEALAVIGKCWSGAIAGAIEPPDGRDTTLDEVRRENILAGGMD